jgi:hypothetical protein
MPEKFPINNTHDEEASSLRLQEGLTARAKVREENLHSAKPKCVSEEAAGAAVSCSLQRFLSSALFLLLSVRPIGELSLRIQKATSLFELPSNCCSCPAQWIRIYRDYQPI